MFNIYTFVIGLNVWPISLDMKCLCTLKSYLPQIREITKYLCNLYKYMQIMFLSLMSKFT